MKKPNRSLPDIPSSQVNPDLLSALSSRLVGQPDVLRAIAPYIEMHLVGLSPPDRPAGVFLLLGPTGTGKTRTVEIIADILHGSEKSFLKIDCGEYQMEHEVAKLIGAPPGYLGHRETTPVLGQAKLASVASEACRLSLVLFDEIEKAAPSLMRLLLGVLDKATLRLGDNSSVNFENTLIFLTSNLGAQAMMKEMAPAFGFQSPVPPAAQSISDKLTQIGLNAIRRVFPPEFVNRIDVVCVYRPLDTQALSAILDQQVLTLQQHINLRLASRSFRIEVTDSAREFLLKHGTSMEYGARELKRVILRHVTQPLGSLVASGKIAAGGRVAVDSNGEGAGLMLIPLEPVAEPRPPLVLLVDDNLDLLMFLERALSHTGWDLVCARNVQEAVDAFGRQHPDVALIDYLLPDGNGVDFARKVRRKSPEASLILMTGLNLNPKHELVLKDASIQLLRKPFSPEDLVRHLQAGLSSRNALRN